MLRNPQFYRLALIVALLGLGAFSVHLSRRVSDLERQRQRLETEARLVELEHVLLAPAEAILTGGKLDDEIAKVRQEFYAAHGITQFVPFGSVMRQPGRVYEYPDGRLTEKSSVELASTVANGSSENEWMNMAYQHLLILAMELEGREQPDDPYLGADLSEFRKRIRPLAIRWLKSHHVMPRAAAERVLLALGDRSAELFEIVQLTRHQEGTRRVSGAFDVFDTYDIPLPEDHLVRTEWPVHSKEESRAHWQRIRDLADELERQTHREHLQNMKKIQAVVQANRQT